MSGENGGNVCAPQADKQVPPPLGCLRQVSIGMGAANREIGPLHNYLLGSLTLLAARPWLGQSPSPRKWTDGEDQCYIINKSGYLL